MITAKVKCTTKEPNTGSQVTLVFEPDYANGRHEEWAEATPALTLRMVVKGDVADRFTQGQTFTLQFVEDD